MRRTLAAVALLAGTLLVSGCAGPPLAGSPSATREQTGRALPVEITIPRIGATSSLVGLGLNPDDTVEVPPVEQPLQAGWYRLGAVPGEDGPAVILGHVDGGGRPGIFHKLHELVAGDEIQVRRADGSTAVFAVNRVQQVPKADFPTEAVYGEADGPELRVVTCGGAFDQARRSYRDNVIVYASLTATRP